MWFSNTWSWFAGGMWKCLELQTRKALGCCEPILVEASDGNLEARALTGMQSIQGVKGHLGKCFSKVEKAHRGFCSCDARWARLHFELAIEVGSIVLMVLILETLMM